ncbi:hypothetical protein BLOT_015219 [Blomia tropicalis]|nr:hypothetical protein BLOT_015219 [Blomia tropicalis]
MLKSSGSIFNIFRFLTMEPIVFIVILIYMLKRIPTDQLIQDKICIQRYNLSVSYCHNLPIIKDDPIGMKSTILTDVTRMALYINFINTIPVVFISIIIGPFIDNYKPAKRLLLIFASIMTIAEMSILALNAYFFHANYYLIFLSHLTASLCGGPLVSLTTIWAYTSSVTPEHIRLLRMVFLELCIFAGPPIGTAISGHMLDMHTPFIEHEPRNYTTIFLIGAGCAFISFLIALLLVDEEKDKILFRKYFPKSETNDEIVKKDPCTEMKPSDTKLIDTKPSTGLINSLFTFQNVRDMIQTFVRPRPYGIRLQMFCLIFSTVTIMIAYMGPSVFLYQYLQKVFAWGPADYSNYVTFNSLINIFTTLIFAPIFLKVFKFADLTCSLIAFHMLLIQNLVRLLSLSVWTFYVALPFYSFNSMSMVGVRAYLAKLVDRNELGKIFALMSAIDSITPLISSLIFSTIFGLTIDSIPNLPFAAVCVTLIVGISSLYIVASRSKRTLAALESDRNIESQA